MNTMQVGGEEFTSPDGTLKVAGAKAGTWRIIRLGRSEMYLHNKLSVEVASSLSIWEDVANTGAGAVKITRDENYEVVGIAVRK